MLYFVAIPYSNSFNSRLREEATVKRSDTRCR